MLKTVKPQIPVSSVLCAFLLTATAPAEQFDNVPRSVCTNALAYVQPGSIVISYCSQCDREYIEIWKVKDAFAADLQDRDQFQLTLFAKKLFRSKEALAAKELRPGTKFVRARGGEKSLVVDGVDLAYIYVKRPDGSFHVLAMELNLEPLHCAVETITLPPALLAALEK
jgi:hypothetical protein